MSRRAVRDSQARDVVSLALHTEQEIVVAGQPHALNHVPRAKA